MSKIYPNVHNQKKIGWLGKLFYPPLNLALSVLAFSSSLPIFIGGAFTEITQLNRLTKKITDPIKNKIYENSIKKY